MIEFSQTYSFMYFFSGKCFNKLNFHVKDSLIKGAVFAEPGAVEVILKDLRSSVSTNSDNKSNNNCFEGNTGNYADKQIFGDISRNKCYYVLLLEFSTTY